MSADQDKPTAGLLAAEAWRAKQQAAEQERTAIEQLTANAEKLADSVRQLAHIIKVQTAKIESLEQENSGLKQALEAALQREATNSQKGDAS